MHMFLGWMYQKSVKEVKFDQFNELLPEIKMQVFRLSDNKRNFQLTSKYWNEKVSIKSPDIFDENGYCGSDSSHMCRIFLNAVYKKNYNGVENILKNSYIKMSQNKLICYSVVDIDYKDKMVILDPYSIVNHNFDIDMLKLLQEYNVVNLSATKCEPTPLIMACLGGNSDAIEYSGDEINVKRALGIIVDCDYEKCMQQLLNKVHDPNVFGAIADLFTHDENKSLFCLTLLQKVCKKKSCKVLKVLLSDGQCKVNEILNNMTLLDELLELEKKDNSFAPVIGLLKEHGARTSEQIAKDRQLETSFFYAHFFLT